MLNIKNFKYCLQLKFLDKQIVKKYMYEQKQQNGCLNLYTL